jgi:8-oxo-dGTP pyrophosphatase MutT (NUDIX family)
VKLIKRNKIYEDEWLTFYKDDVEFPDGSKGTYSWVDRKNGVGIVVLTKDQKVLLNKEYRYVIDDYSWEIPGGGIDEGENAHDAAKRELYEETGIKATEFKKLGLFYPLNSFNTETITVFTTHVEQKPVTASKTEVSEEMDEQKFISFPKVLEMIDRGEITDSITANVLQIVIRNSKKNL